MATDNGTENGGLEGAHLILFRESFTGEATGVNLEREPYTPNGEFDQEETFESTAGGLIQINTENLNAMNRTIARYAEGNLSPAEQTEFKSYTDVFESKMRDILESGDPYSLANLHKAYNAMIEYRNNMHVFSQKLYGRVHPDDQAQMQREFEFDHDNTGNGLASFNAFLRKHKEIVLNDTQDQNNTASAPVETRTPTV